MPIELSPDFHVHQLQQQQDREIGDLALSKESVGQDIPSLFAAFGLGAAFASFP